jgi:hypothetical protein
MAPTKDATLSGFVAAFVGARSRSSVQICEETAPAVVAADVTQQEMEEK